MNVEMKLIHYELTMNDWLKKTKNDLKIELLLYYNKSLCGQI